MLSRYGSLVDINEAKDNGLTAACLAAYKGHLDALKYLESVKADLSYKTPKEGLGLGYFAAKKGHIHILMYLKSQNILDIG